MARRDTSSPSSIAEYLDVSADQAALLECVATLAKGPLAERAESCDRDALFPAESFADLAQAGVLKAAVPRDWGGHGLGPGRQTALILWMLTKSIASADLSLARCWEGHCNAMCLLAGVANDGQKRRWFEGVVERGEIWAAWSGEPQNRKPGQSAIGTNVTEVPGGYRITGSKVFATGATGVDWAVLLVSTAGPGGARHATGSLDSQLLLCCDLSDPTVESDDSWWDPIGMRATVSHKVIFNDTFIPAEQSIGMPGVYLRDHWQARFTPHYAASFLGAAEGAYQEAMSYVEARQKFDDPYIQHRIAEMRMDIDTAHLWLSHTARLWAGDHRQQAEITGIQTRLLVERLAVAAVQNAIHICGARSLNRPSRLERIFRDLSFYVRHDSADHLLATIGKVALGSGHDVSFFRK